MNIGQASKTAGVPAKTIRYYEDIGLIQVARTQNGYRDYGSEDLHKLAFVARARRFGFSIEQCRDLLMLFEDQDRASSDVKAIAQKHLTEVETRLEELLSVRDTLKSLVKSCSGDDRPNCPILEDLANPQ